jgi:hypothetical protein
MSAVYCDKNLEEWINIKFCVQIGNTARETVAILTLAYGEYAMKKSSVSNSIGGSREGKKKCSQFKTMFVCFFDFKEIIHYEFNAQRQTVYQQCHLEEVTRLWESFRGKDPNSGLTSGFSTMTIPLRMMREFLAKKSITKMDHPPPHLALCNFGSFQT